MLNSFVKENFIELKLIFLRKLGCIPDILEKPLMNRI
jgi:hypothetical protein